MIASSPKTKVEMLAEAQRAASPACLQAQKIRSIKDLRRATLLRDNFHPWDRWIGSLAIPANAAYFLVFPPRMDAAPPVREFCAWLREQAPSHPVG